MSDQKPARPHDCSTPEGRAAVMNPIADATAQLMENLVGRWMDEKEYEDFAEYQKVLNAAVLKVAPAGSTVANGRKGRVECLITIPGFPYVVRLYCTTRAAGWEAVQGGKLKATRATNPGRDRN